MHGTEAQCWTEKAAHRQVIECSICEIARPGYEEEASTCGDSCGAGGGGSKGAEGKGNADGHGCIPRWPIELRVSVET